MKSRHASASAFDSFNFGFVFAAVGYLCFVTLCAAATYSMLLAFIFAGVVCNLAAVCIVLCWGTRRFTSDSAITGYATANVLLLFVTCLLIVVHFFMPEPDFPTK